jgi:BirA family biotin operon repressor/biotin-[acetyl-CoA-carboxylase] ligase
LSIKKVHFIGKTLIELPSCPSTNDHALSLLSKNKPKEGTVILTFNQTQGRGQVGSQWIGEAYQNIAFTCILYPHFLSPKEQISLNQAVALAAFHLVNQHTEKVVKIKWPNDIYVGDKKVAGILIQNLLSSNKFNTSIVGIGINVNQQKFPPELPLATSLGIEVGRPFHLKELALELCELLERAYDQLKKRSLDKIHEEYLRHLYRFHQLGTFQSLDGSVFEGQIVGISSSGRLQVRRENDGTTEEFGIKEIRFL